MRLGGALVLRPVAVGRLLTPLQDPHSSPAPPPHESGCVEGGRHLLGGWEPQSPPRPFSLCPRPPCPARVPPPRPRLAERRERTAARGAHGGRSAQRGIPRREPSGGWGRPRGGHCIGRAVETPGAAGRARLVSEAAGCQEPESGRRDPAAPAHLVRCPSWALLPPPSIPARP